LLRHIESTAGVMAGIVGLIGLLLFAFSSGIEESEEVAIGVGQISSTRETTRLIHDQTGAVIGILVVALPLLGAIAISAWRHARTSSTWSCAVLIVSTLFLWFGTIVGMFSFGLFVLPAAILATVSLVSCGLGRDPVEVFSA
jgi:hypothetical protein